MVQNRSQQALEPESRPQWQVTRTKKFRIIGKYGTCCHASFKKMMKKIKTRQQVKCSCFYYYKAKIKRWNTGNGTASTWKQRVVGMNLPYHLCYHSQMCHQETKGTERPVMLPSLVYNKWVNLLPQRKGSQ